MGNSKRPFENRYIFQKIDTEEKAYWLGFLYADGSVGSTDNRIELSLAEKDFHHLEKFKEFIGLDNKISYREQVKAYRYCFKDEIFKNILIEKGCVPRKSLILKFPTEEQVPKELIRHFIRGYFDGDGWFTNTPHCFETGLISTKEFIVECLKILPDGLKKDSCFKSAGKATRYSFYSFSDVYHFLNYLYKDCTIYLDRKYLSYVDFIQNGSKYHKT